MPVSVVYVTAQDREQALRIGRKLVEERLVACANLFEGVASLYWWNDAVQEEHETVLIAKTRTENLDAVIARVKELHSYECPCVVSWPIGPGNADYLEWIIREARG